MMARPSDFVLDAVEFAVQVIFYPATQTTNKMTSTRGIGVRWTTYTNQIDSFRDPTGIDDDDQNFVGCKMVLGVLVVTMKNVC